MKTWEEAAHDAARRAFDWYADSEDTNDITPLVNTFQWVRDTEWGEHAEGNLSKKLGAVAEIALELLVPMTGNKPDEQVMEIVDLIIRKQHDYGHGNILAFGEAGILVRISDKVARLENLWNKQGAKNESVQDTLQDIIGYTIIAHMLHQGTFSTELAEDIVKMSAPFTRRKALA